MLKLMFKPTKAEELKEAFIIYNALVHSCAVLELRACASQDEANSEYWTEEYVAVSDTAKLLFPTATLDFRKEVEKEVRTIRRLLNA